QQQHIYHEAIHVSTHRSPFNCSDNEAAFFTTLHKVSTLDIILEGFELMATKGDSLDPIFKMISIDHWRSKQIDISLADFVVCLLIYCFLSTPLVVPMDSSTICQGANGACNCEKFFPRNENGHICLECSHGMSKHRNAGGGPLDPPPSVPPPKLPLPAS
ncbi:hypothetical protein J3R82DRAFT_11249, partial [Butyriboletus roseoflavus]